MLPTMIQMGICESSCLEISNVICKGSGGAVSIALLSWGPGWAEAWGRKEGRRQPAAGGRAVAPSPGGGCRHGRHAAC